MLKYDMYYTMNMSPSKFLEEIKDIEDKLGKKVGSESQRLTFPDFVEKLLKDGQMDNELAQALVKLWKIRNAIYGSPTMEAPITHESQDLLIAVIHHPTFKKYARV